MEYLEPASASVTLMIDFEEPLRVDGQALPAAWVGGPSEAPDTVELGSKQTGLDLKLNPLAAYRIFGAPVHELAGAVVSLDDLVGAAGRDFVDGLLDATIWRRRFELVDRFLVERATAGPMPTPAVAHVWNRLSATAGRLPIGALARELQMSRQHLTAIFHEQVGLPPKTVARLMRFARVRVQLAKRPARWAEVAHDCGYFDQSHLIRDFRQFAGTTPSSFLADQPLSSITLSTKIPSVQDDWAGAV